MAPPVALRVVLTDGLAVTAGGDVLNGGDHLVVTQLALRHVTRSQGGRRRGTGRGCGGSSLENITKIRFRKQEELQDTRPRACLLPSL